MVTDKIEIVAKTVEDAKAEALAALGISEEQAKVTVIEQGSKGGLFGIGSKPARVLVEKRQSPEEIAKTFLKEITLIMNLSIKIEATSKDRQVSLNMIGENMGILIGKRGQTLDALQYIVSLAVNQRSDYPVTVVLDTENYRRRRRETLETLAHSIARKVKSSRKSITLEPMSRFERHIIHTTLQNERHVRTSSEGNEPFRYVVVSVK